MSLFKLFFPQQAAKSSGEESSAVRKLVEPISVALSYLFITALIQFQTTALVGTDGYYHIKMGWLIRQFGLTPEFIWLPNTILSADAYYNHHLLYHLYLALFSFGDPTVNGGADLIWGAKIATVLLMGGIGLSLWWLLKSLKVPMPAVWAIAALGLSSAYLYRMNMVRAQSASLLILLISLYLLHTGKYRWLLPLGFVYVWTYNAFPLLIAVVMAYIVAVGLLEKRIEYRPFLWATLGIGLGIIINPYFPENVIFTTQHLLPKLGESAVQVGNEWRPYRTLTLIENSGPTLLLLIGGVLALGWREKKIDGPTLTSLFLVFGFGYMLFESRRFIEYFPPFVLIFAALATAPLLKQWTPSAGKFNQWIGPICAIALVIPIYFTLPLAFDSVKKSQPVEKYAAAARWLDEQTTETVHIFQTDWDDFTRLFFHNTNATYTAGLDPTFFQLHNPEQFDLWVDITRGKIDQPSQIIADEFGADYVFSDLNHQKFMSAAADDPGLVELYRDEFAVIYEVNP